ncbi:MAG: hypothetical protein LBG92_00985 [Prevotellaceae bacterium]|jgi:hypothetical protein|nr:hypothetical protein [Prevotellaceae bacterium]
MLLASIYLAESHNFYNRRWLTGGRNSETITLLVKAEPCVSENIQVLAFSQFFWDYVCPYVKRHTVMKILAESQYILK